MWPLVVVAQVVVSSFMTILTRKLSLANSRVFFTVGFITYTMVALMGISYSFLFGVETSYIPDQTALTYIIPAALGIVTAWLILYRLIALIGAGNAVLVTMANYIGTATLGYLVLGEPVSTTFLLGAVLIIFSLLLSFSIQPDTAHQSRAPIYQKILLVTGMVVSFSVGMLFEKLAIDAMGVWEYARFGWLMQFIVAIVLVSLVGRKELRFMNRVTVKYAVIVGVITSVAGGLYILALSLGTLSGTMLATSAKITLTAVLAYFFLRERNALTVRLTALMLSIIGMWFIVR